MYSSSSFHLPLLFLFPLLQLLSALASEPEIHDDDAGLWSFITRPDIRAPKWNVSIYDKEALAPGYWFFGPYETLNMDDSLGNGWIGPHIYDQEGTLVWSGAPMFKDGNVEDFRVSNVLGQPMMTVMDQRHAKGLFIDQHYQVQEKKNVNGQGIFNSHEFNFVEDGTKALVIYTKHHKFPEEESKTIGVDGECRVDCNGFNEYDVETWETTFQWDSCGNIALNESTLRSSDMSKKCGEGRRWDYVHANSVDKTRDGDYILSCRHSDAIYKVSHKDKSIIWRLGGTQSDFEHIDGFNFSRQHNIRYRGGNDTHTIISMLDNAKGKDSVDPTHEFSRGLLIALDESSDPMTAEVIAHYDHPDGNGSLAFRRGNYQALDNGNVFMCWSEQALQSEHSADGKMLMQARLYADWLGTYRSYKFEFNGFPTEPIALNGTTFAEEEGGKTKTAFHVSWNGATEVDSWNLYRTNKRGRKRILLGSQKKDGFETKLIHDEYIKFASVEAVAKNGTSLGISKSLAVKPGGASSDEVAEADHASKTGELEEEWYEQPLFIAGASVGAFLATCAAVLMALRYGKRRGVTPKHLVERLTRGRYTALKQEKELQERKDRNPLMGHRDWSEEDLELRDGDPFALDDEDDEPSERPGRDRL